jgi:hypothetical protein
MLIWLELPETYEFKSEFGSSYFVSIEISNASMKYSVDTMEATTLLEKDFANIRVEFGPMPTLQNH